MKKKIKKIIKKVKKETPTEAIAPFEGLVRDDGKKTQKGVVV